MKILRNMQITLWTALCLSFASLVQAQTTVPKPGTPTSPQQAKQLLDYSVLDVVLSDLLTNRDFDEATGRKQVLLGSRSPTQAPIDNLGLREEGRPVHTLPTEVRADLWRRNSEVAHVPLTTALVPLATDMFDGGQYNWNNFHPRNPQILVHDISRYLSFIDGGTKFKDDYPGAKGFIVAWLPGYSKDQKTAVLHFMTGPEASHGAVGTYLLIRTGDNWKIRWSKIVHFL